jgi:hypothetical protein
LYVTALRLEPSPPLRGQDIGFYPTFLNATGATQTYRWRVYIYRPDNFRNSFGETSVGQTTIPVDTSEQKAFGTWKVTGGGCEDFVARVGWIDTDNRITHFAMPDGQLFEYRFPMCQ